MASITDTLTSSVSWIGPPTVTSVVIEAWGAGAGGRPQENINTGGDGGGGGAYAKKNTYNVNAGNSYTVTVGTGGNSNQAGGDSSFVDGATTVCLAKGAANRTGGASGTSTGDTKNAGGSGGASSGIVEGAGGGGGAGSTGVGGDGANGTSTVGGVAGTGTATGGGDGGTGGDQADGLPGNAYGGGGGGGGKGGTAWVGGIGANGAVAVTYTLDDVVNAPDFVAAGAQTVTNTDSATLSPALPTGWAAGDLHLLIIAGRPEASPTYPTVSIGWDQLGTDIFKEVGTYDLSLSIWYRFAQAGDGSPTVTPGASYTGGTAAGCSAQIIGFRGVSASVPFDVASITNTSAAAQTWSTDSITPVTSPTMILSIVATADDNALALTGQSFNFQVAMGGTSYDTNVGSDHSVGVAYTQMASAAAVSMPTWNQTVNSADAWAGITIALRSATSGSSSISASISPSISPSASESPSASLSPSSSVSPSLSPSASASASPSAGYQGYTKGDYANLPTNDNDLEISYTAQNLTDIATKDDNRVDQSATAQYAIHQFKDFMGSSSSVDLEWEGQTNTAPSWSTVYLQIFNQVSGEWENVDSDNSSSAATDFTLSGTVPSLTNYKDGSNVISCRVYQLAV